MNRLMMWMLTPVLVVITLLIGAESALAQIDVGSTGADGAFNPTGPTYTVDLAEATTVGDPIQTGKGQYDPERWAVVFNYTSINIPSGVTVRFTNHPSGAPVVWLVSGSVTMAGQVNLDGPNQTGGLPTGLAPGGARGGAGIVSTTTRASGGYGPGGSDPKTGNYSGGGSFFSAGRTDGSTGPAAPTYGNPQIVPLIGGSGGGGSDYNGLNGGGAGGGAILIAANGMVTVTGSIFCRGGAGDSGAGSGSGGAIRIVADVIAGNGTLSATGNLSGYYGGDGRIRLEANDISKTLNSAPEYRTSLPGPQPLIWPPNTAPRVQVMTFDGHAVPSDPKAALDFPSQDVTTSNAGPMQISFQTWNVPTNWTFRIRGVPKAGPVVYGSNIQLQSVDGTNAMWTATMPALPDGTTTVQILARAP